jgi:hypothetical protein
MPQNYWMSGLSPSSGILNKGKHSVSETGSVSASGEGSETSTLLGPLEKVNLNHSPPHEDGNRSSLPKRCVFLYLEFRAMDKVQKPSNSGCYTPSSKSFILHMCLVYGLPLGQQFHDHTED